MTNSPMKSGFLEFDQEKNFVTMIPSNKPSRFVVKVQSGGGETTHFHKEAVFIQKQTLLEKFDASQISQPKK